MACIFALTIFGCLSAAAQPAPPREAKSPVPAKTPADPGAEAKAAFLGLSAPDRKALQDALGWLGFYNGVVDGAYGRRTIEALSAYQQWASSVDDGVLTPKQLEALKNAAAKLKADTGFKLADDPVTGIRFGAPMKWLDSHETGAGFTSFESSDGKIGLYLKETSGELAALYKTLTTAPTRKVTYKYFSANAFFVVAGEEGDKKSYRRYAVSPADAGNGKVLRGFAFVYPKARSKALDPVALAIANAFDPFPSPLPPAANATPSPSPNPETPKLTAVALVVLPGVAITTLPPAQCRTPTIDGAPARFVDGADGPGLIRLAGAFGERAAAPAIAEGGDDLVALSLAANGETGSELQLASAALAPGGGGQVVAALGPVATGAPLFDRHGQLVAFMAPGEPARRRADVTLAEPHATVSAAGVDVRGTPVATQTPLSGPQLAAKLRAAVVGVYCGP